MRPATSHFPGLSEAHDLCYPPHEGAEVALSLGSAVAVAAGAARAGRRAVGGIERIDSWNLDDLDAGATFERLGALLNGPPPVVAIVHADR